MSTPNADSVRCEPCGMVHDGPLCSCGERLFLKGAHWTHVHTVDPDHWPAPAQIDGSVWLEPIGFGRGTFGPYADEIDASAAMDDLGLSDSTHKIVVGPAQSDGSGVSHG